MTSALLVLMLAAATLAQAQTTQAPYKPEVGQEGKDVVWVPTPPALTEKMLDLAGVTSQDVVMDLGSGDGRMVIAAAKRGARATGVEFNADLVELSKQTAIREGVADKAQFLQGDMYEADISKATVLALFLLPDNLNRLRPKFLAMTPGSRIVSNTFEIDEWQHDAVATLDGPACTSWCGAVLWIVPAKAGGSWQLPDGALTLKQNYQMLSGTLRVGNGMTTLSNGRMRGAEISFSVNGVEYTGRLNDNGSAMEGLAKSGASTSRWIATRISVD